MNPTLLSFGSGQGASPYLALQTPAAAAPNPAASPYQSSSTNPLAPVATNYSLPGAPSFTNPGTIDFSGNPANLTADYASAYNSAVNYNNALTSSINNVYGQAMVNQVNSEMQTEAGWGNLQNQVQGLVANNSASAQQAINDSYAQNIGSAENQMINSGLGNTTVQQAVNRGLTLDREKANVALTNQQSALQASYLDKIGEAGLGYQAQATQANTALAVQQANWMNTISAPYPDASVYANLAAMYGQQQQANADRALQSQMASRMFSMAGNPGYSGGNHGALAYGSPFGPMPSYPATMGDPMPYPTPTFSPPPAPAAAPPEYDYDYSDQIGPSEPLGDEVLDYGGGGDF